MTRLEPLLAYQRWIARLVLPGIVILLVVGAALDALGAPAGRMALAVAFSCLVAVPIASVVAVLVMTVRARQWSFVLAALAVLALATYSLWDKLGS